MDIQRLRQIAFIMYQIIDLTVYFIQRLYHLPYRKIKNQQGNGQTDQGNLYDTLQCQIQTFHHSGRVIIAADNADDGAVAGNKGHICRDQITVFGGIDIVLYIHFPVKNRFQFLIRHLENGTILVAVSRTVRINSVIYFIFVCI